MKGFNSARVVIDEVQSFECPKSLMLRMPESTELIQITGQAREMSGSMGNPATWPANYFDAVTIIQREVQVDKIAIDTARFKATV
jgi:hypothetical protein